MTHSTRAGLPRTGPRPEVWVSGPDPEVRKRYYAWLRSRSQAAYRKEPWTITFEQYQQLWGDQWARRGRGPDDLQMIRKDFLAAWTADNVSIVTRPEFTCKQIEIRRYYQANPRLVPRPPQARR